MMRGWACVALALLMPCATFAETVDNAARDPGDWRPSGAWRGFNVLSMFIKGSRPNAPYGVIPPRFGYASPQEFREDDFKIMHDWGMNFARIPLDYRYWILNGDREKFDETALGYIDRLLMLGKRYGIHIQLNFHRAPGFMTGRPKSDCGDVWHDPEDQRICAKHWAMFARRYRDVPNEELSFNLFNEPPDIPEVAAVCKMMIAAIRREDPKRFIVCDGYGVGTRPIPELYGIHGVGQAARGYKPGLVTGNPDAVWPWRPDCPTGVFTTPAKKSWYAGPLVIEGLPSCEVELRFSQVSGSVKFEAEADGMTIGRFALCPKADDPEWKDVRYLDKWKIWQGTFMGVKRLKLDEPTRRFVLNLVNGDWALVTGCRFMAKDGEVAVLPFDAMTHKGKNFSQIFQGWKGSVSFRSKEEDVVPWKYKEPGQEFLYRKFFKPWVEARQKGVFVIVGEFGISELTPHDVAVRFLRDELAVWEDLGFSWAMWGLHRDHFGVMDSGRTNFLLEDFYGHKLDRPMLNELLRYTCAEH